MVTRQIAALKIQIQWAKYKQVPLDNNERQQTRKRFSTSWQTLNKGVDKIEKDLRLKKDLGMKRTDGDDLLMDPEAENPARQARVIDFSKNLPRSHLPTHGFADPWRRKENHERLHR